METVREQVERPDTWVHFETRALERIEYEIRVVLRKDTLWGVWKCKACGGSGARKPREATRTQALRCAQASVSEHHDEAHSQSSTRYGN